MADPVTGTAGAGAPPAADAGKGTGKKKGPRGPRPQQCLILKLMATDPKTGVRNWQDTDLEIKGKSPKAVIKLLIDRGIMGEYMPVKLMRPKAIKISTEEKTIVTVS